MRGSSSVLLRMFEEKEAWRQLKAFPARFEADCGHEKL